MTARMFSRDISLAAVVESTGMRDRASASLLTRLGRYFMSNVGERIVDCVDCKGGGGVPEVIEYRPH